MVLTLVLASQATVLFKRRSKTNFVDAGTIHYQAADMPERLKQYFAGIDRIVKFMVTKTAVEQVLSFKTLTPLKLGQSTRGCYCCTGKPDLQVCQNTPHARLNSRWSVIQSTKEQVLNDGGRLPKPTASNHSKDAADALAAAICHAHASRQYDKLAVLNALGGIARTQPCSSRRR